MRRTVLLLVLIAACILFIALWIFGEKKESVEISKFSPQGEIQEQKHIEICFTRELVPGDKEGDKIDPSLIEISPELEHICKWHSRSVVRCYLDPMKPGQEYEVKVSRDIVPKESKLKLRGDREFRIKMVEFKIKHVEVTYRLYYHPPETRIKIEFTHPVVPDELESNMKILAPDGKDLPYSMRTYRSSKEIELQTYLSDFALKEWKHVTLKISKSLPDESQLVLLGEDYEKEIELKTGGKLKVTQVQTGQKGMRYHISIGFSSAVDPEKAKPFISIEPEVDVEYELHYRQVFLTGNFLPGEKYTVTIHKDLISTTNQMLEEDFEQNVTFPDLNPSLSLIGSGHYLPRKGSLNIGIETVNLDKVHVKVKKIFVNNLVYFLGASAPYHYYGMDSRERMLRSNLEVLGQEILEKDLEIEKARNKIVTTTIPVY